MSCRSSDFSQSGLSQSGLNQSGPLLIDGRPVVVFSDFDGTITQKDVIIMIMEAFAPPVWRDIVDEILNQRTLSIKEGVSRLFRLISPEKKPEIEAFVKENVRFRVGFEDFLSFCQEQAIPFQVLSGGVDFFVRPVLEAFRSQVEIFCNGATFDSTQTGIELTMPYFEPDCTQCGQCACCKISLMNRLPAETTFRIAIGDSLTDLPMARVADWTFARGQLIDYCREEGLTVTPYEDFRDIQQAIQARIQATSTQKECQL
jgi:2-hydroxy-3-keto-5-methylthiopentenyl-1-phosphate phosphatase